MTDEISFQVSLENCHGFSILDENVLESDFVLLVPRGVARS